MGLVDGLTVAITVTAAGFNRATVEMIGSQRPIGRINTPPEMADLVIKCPRSLHAFLVNCSTAPAHEGFAAQ